MTWSKLQRTRLELGVNGCATRSLGSRAQLSQKDDQRPRTIEIVKQTHRARSRRRNAGVSEDFRNEARGNENDRLEHV